MPTAPEPNWYSDEAATFGDRVAAAREALGMSPDELARRLGVKIKTLNAWEQDLAEPRANKLQMLAGILNVSFLWLLTGEGDGISSPDAGETKDADRTHLLTEMRQLRAEMVRNAERLGRLEKRLQSLFRDAE